ncbi:MAG: polyprenyl diphosphate synthase [Bacilli bacterium]
MDVPNHIGIIVDGNGRWAVSKNKTRSEGHLAGSKNLEKLILYINDKKINYLSLYVFSADNFKREKQEVEYLMKLFVNMFKMSMKKYKKLNIKVLFSGRKENLADDVIKCMNEMINETKDNTGMVINFCLNYSSQLEIIDATKKIIADNIKEIDENIFSKYLYNDLPMIDLLIRTSGEQRLSNFMLWQLAYTELFFVPIYFPDFKGKDFDKVLNDYFKRNRRFGGS